MITFGANGLDLNGLTGGLWRCHHRLGCKIERDAQDVGIFDVEQPVVIQIIRLSAKRSANNLLTEQLRSERTNA